ncbi:CbtB-domain containing protein [Lentzea sp. NEAU-D13]|uniref:CbtB-domain containing protein n=1 Tax=Lentzea alba TaxID=2714351 RepID=A0A7C9VR42_9PSEU|nr:MULTISPECIES: CbtB-domain containing protein [Lentzea]NGY60872.1 CbtB-domain containing protein [Lentzea alba]
MTSPAAHLSAVRVPKWALAVSLLGLIVTYLVLQENGLALGASSELLHEFFHDGRHALGVPCH